MYRDIQPHAKFKKSKSPERKKEESFLFRLLSVWSYKIYIFSFKQTQHVLVIRLNGGALSLSFHLMSKFSTSPFRFQLWFAKQVLILPFWCLMYTVYVQSNDSLLQRTPGRGHPCPNVDIHSRAWMSKPGRGFSTPGASVWGGANKF